MDAKWLSEFLWRDALDASDVDIGAMRRVVLAIADRECTRKQRAVLGHYLDGLPLPVIAAKMGTAKSTAHRHLYGTRKMIANGERRQHGGALQKLRAAINNDTTLKQELARMGKQQQEQAITAAETVTAWFSQLRPSQELLYGPLTVLLVAHFACDSKRSMRIEDLCLYQPRRAVNAALTPLRAAGYIATDGVTLTIRRTPIDDLTKDNK